jgi:hypothetical protein
MDVSLRYDANGGIGITDQFGWILNPGPDGTTNGQAIQFLTPSDSSGIGIPALLPMAPLDMLLSGMSGTSSTTSQLAIAIQDTGGELLLLSKNGTYMPIADLPLLKDPTLSAALSATLV